VLAIVIQAAQTYQLCRQLSPEKLTGSSDCLPGISGGPQLLLEPQKIGLSPLSGPLLCDFLY
jgi:hypothetical protein